jgi:uncharacterized protein
MYRKVYKTQIFSFLLTYVLILISCILHAQNIKTDLQLIKENNADLLTYNQLKYKQFNNTKPIEYKRNNFISKYNPVSLAFTGTMLLYQHIISPQLFRHCIYEISCSNYSKQAIHHFGIIKGVFLSADRLMRCNSIAKDEIPPYEFDKNGLAVDEQDKYNIH